MTTAVGYSANISLHIGAWKRYMNDVRGICGKLVEQLAGSELYVS